MAARRKSAAAAVVAIGLTGGPPSAHAFHAPSSRARHPTSPFHNAAVHSPLFTSSAQRHRRRRTSGPFGRTAPGTTTGRGGSPTELNVLTTPEAIFEETSTQNLLDDLIDESVRTSARQPVMMQFDPSSGWM